MRYETNTYANSPRLSPKPTQSCGGSRANIGIAHPIVYLFAAALWLVILNALCLAVEAF